MSTAQKFLYWDNSSQPNFQQWGKGLSDQLTAMGWTKTADTGQVDWSTNPAVPASGVYLYEIRQPASDPLQLSGGVPLATAFYLKIEYGSQSTGIPGLRFSVGTGVNGSGTLTGYVIGPTYFGTGFNVNQGAVGRECDFSWDVDRLALLLFRDPTTNSQLTTFFAIERTRNADGTASTDGVTVWYSQSAITGCQTIVFGVGLGLFFSGGSFIISYPAVAPYGLAALNNVAISPVFPNYGKYGNPVKGFCAIKAPDIMEGALITTTLYGTSHTYLMTKHIYYGLDVSTSNWFPAILWD